MRGSPDQILRLIAFGLGALAALFAAIALANNAAPEAPVTPEDLDTDTACRAAWAEHRRRFLGLPGDNSEKE